MSDVFRLDHLHLRNYRCFSGANLTLSEDITVIVADNGGGKSALLDAIGAALGPPTWQKGKRLTKEDRERRTVLRQEDATHARDQYPYADSQFPVQLTARATVRTDPLEWSLTLDRHESQADVSGSARSLLWGTEANLALPIIAHYGTSRTTASLRDPKLDLGHVNRDVGYRHALGATAGFDELREWLAQTAFDATSSKGSVWEPVLYCVYDAATKAMAQHGVSGVEYLMEERDLLLTYTSAHRGLRHVPMADLADGFRVVLGLVCDIAFRAGVLNPHLGSDAAMLVEGTVLIDEVDLHLHPKWQATVLQDLRRAFPRIQFVVTTHSPWIVSSVEHTQVRQLVRTDEGTDIETPKHRTQGATAIDVTETVLDGPTRADTDFSRDLAALADRLTRGDLESAGPLAERVREGLGDAPDVDAERVLRQYDRAVKRSETL